MYSSFWWHLYVEVLGLILVNVFYKYEASILESKRLMCPFLISFRQLLSD